MPIISFGCLHFSREPCLLYAFYIRLLAEYFFAIFSAKPIDFYLQDSCQTILLYKTIMVFAQIIVLWIFSNN